MRSRLTFLALVLPVLLLGVACSGSDDKAAEGPTTTTTSTTTTIPTLDAKDIDAKASPYCAAWADIRRVAAPAITGDPAKDAAARKGRYAKIVPLAEKLVADAPPEIVKQAQFALDQAKEVAATGSDKPFTAEGAAKVQQDLAKYAQDHCAN